MDFVNVKRESFKHNFLKQIIMRLDFQGVLQSELEIILTKVKPYLKGKNFNRYERKLSNDININFGEGIFRTEYADPNIKNIEIHSFTNEDNGYTVDLSMNYICVDINTNKYISFEEYADIFVEIADIYRTSIDFFTVKRLGLRKINFCFFRDKSNIRKYFNENYFDYFDLFEGTNLFASEKKMNFGFEEYKVNLLTYMEQGNLADEIVYKITLDTDIYLDQMKNIEELVFNKGKIDSINDILFKIYIDAITDEFGSMLSNEETVWSDEIMGVVKNE